MTARVTQLKVTESEWQRTVMETAQRFGWRWYHTFDSRRSAAGFPDCVMVRKGRVLFVELKAENGRIRKAQQAWLDDLEWAIDLHEAGPLEVYVWRPSDCPEVEQVLR